LMFCFVRYRVTSFIKLKCGFVAAYYA